MTKAEWLLSTSPKAMLEFLVATEQASGRKFRFFAVAMCRRVDVCLIDETRNLIKLAERVAEGVSDHRERRAGRTEALIARCHPDQLTKNARGPAKSTVFWALARRPFQAALKAADYSLISAVQFAANNGQMPRGVTRQEWMAMYDATRLRESGMQADVLRDLFGPLPFRAVHIDPSLLKWNDRLVVRLAQAIYDERRWADMPILADALLDSGCDNDDILQHCRNPEAVHARGCFVLDLLLGKD
jgi:hypothetical protein